MSVAMCKRVGVGLAVTIGVRVGVGVSVDTRTTICADGPVFPQIGMIETALAAMRSAGMGRAGGAREEDQE